MEKDIERICKNCLSWIIEVGGREGKGIKNARPCGDDRFSMNETPNYGEGLDEVFIVNALDDLGIIGTGPNFGCIHFKARS